MRLFISWERYQEYLIYREMELEMNLNLKAMISLQTNTFVIETSYHCSCMPAIRVLELKLAIATANLLERTIIMECKVFL